MKILIVTILFCSVVVFSESLAQDSDIDADADCGWTSLNKPPRTYLGILSSINFGQLSSYTPNDLSGTPLMDIEHNPHGSFSLGVRLLSIIGKVRHSRSFITADLMFGRIGFLYSAQDSVLSMTSEKMLGQYALTTKASAFSLNACYNHLVPGTYLGFTAGITTSYIFDVEHSYSVSAGKAILPSSSTIATSDSGRTVQYFDAATSDVNKLQLGVVAGLRYDIRIGRVVFTPFTQFEYGLNGILSGGREHPMIIRVGCAVELFSL